MEGIPPQQQVAAREPVEGYRRFPACARYGDAEAVPRRVHADLHRSAPSRGPPGPQSRRHGCRQMADASGTHMGCIQAETGTGPGPARIRMTLCCDRVTRSRVRLSRTPDASSSPVGRPACPAGWRHRPSLCRPNIPQRSGVDPRSSGQIRPFCTGAKADAGFQAYRQAFHLCAAIFDGRAVARARR
jgi:hypothetical protein